MNEKRPATLLPFRDRAWMWTRQLGAGGLSWVTTFHVKKRLEPWKFVRRVWAEGAAMRVLLVTMLVLAAASVVVADRVAAGDSAVETWRGVVQVALLWIAWSVATAAATRLPAWAFPLATLWLGQTAMLTTGLAFSKTPVAAIPMAWLVVVGGWRCLTEPGKWAALLGWVIMCVVGGLYTAGPSGFRQWTGLEFGAGVTTMAALLLALGAVVRWALPRAKAAALQGASVSFGLVLTGSALVFGGMLAAVWARDHAVLLEWVPDLMRNVDLTVALFWMWLGGGFMLGIWKTVDWGTRRVARLNLTHLVLWAVTTLAVVVLGLEVAVGYRGHAAVEPLALKLSVSFPAFHQWSMGVSYVQWAACRLHVWVTLGFLLLLAVQWLRGRLSWSFWITATSVWIVSYLALTALESSRRALVETAWQAPRGGLMAVAAVVFGCLVDLQGVQKNWQKVPSARIEFFVGWLVVACSVVLVAYLASAGYADTERKLFIVQGMLQLGLVRTVYARAVRRTPVERQISLGDQAVMGLAGYLLGYVLIATRLSGLWPAVAGGLAISTLLVAFRRRRQMWNQAAGAMAGAMAASGALLYWTNPLPLGVPLVQLERFITRGPLMTGDSTEQLAIVAFCSALGALCGWFVFQRGGKTPAEVAAAA